MKKKTTTQADSRRTLLKRLGTGAGVGMVAQWMPGKWTKPIVESVMLPAHAQTSAEPVGGTISCSISPSTVTDPTASLSIARSISEVTGTVQITQYVRCTRSATLMESFRNTVVENFPISPLTALTANSICQDTFGTNAQSGDMVGIRIVRNDNSAEHICEVPVLLG